MSLYRKHRPQKFEEILGQNHVVKTLQGALESSQIGHAYIFAGPRGSGKTSIARILAKAVNCLNVKNNEPCDECDICKQIKEGRFLDLIEIDAASNRGIDEIRELKEKIRFAPNQGKYKLYIIDEVHMLTREAFNALLKTLEEPPSHAIFVLATTEAHKIPLTIMSRCQRFDFKKIDPKKMFEGIKKVVGKEKIKIDDESLRKIIFLSDGSVRDALSYLDQVYAFVGDKEINSNLVEDVLGISKSENMVKFLDLIKEKKSGELIGFINNIIDGGVDFDIFLRDLVNFMRQIFLFKIDKKIPSNELLGIDGAENIINEFSLRELIQLIEIVVEARRSSKFSFIPQLHLELNIIKMLEGCDGKDIIKNKEETNSIEQNNHLSNSLDKNKHSKEGVSSIQEKNDIQNKEADIKKEQNVRKSDESDKIDNWESFLEGVKNENMSIYMALQKAEFSIDKESVNIGICNQFYFDRLQDSKNNQFLVKKIAEHLGEKKELKIIKKDKKEEKKDVISEALSVFGGEIIE